MRRVNGHLLFPVESINPEATDWLHCEYCGVQTRFPEQLAPCKNSPELARAMLDLMEASK